MSKRVFEIDWVMERVREAVRGYEPAAMFQLAEEGYGSVFEQLVACIISIRTLEEVTLPTARRLFARARRPGEMVKLSEGEIEELIGASQFAGPKSRDILAIARRCVVEFGGELPCDQEVLLSFHGVGPKCTNLAMGIGCGKVMGVPVDVHVHRVTNRWGYTRGKTPEQARVELEAQLPRRWWLEINRVLVPFGKHVCTGQRPRCLTCPVLEMCRQVGVGSHR